MYGGVVSGKWRRGQIAKSSVANLAENPLDLADFASTVFSGKFLYLADSGFFNEFLCK